MAENLVPWFLCRRVLSHWHGKLALLTQEHYLKFWLTHPEYRSLALLSVSLTPVAYAAIGPIADLHIVNQVIAPDGYSRATVLAGGTFPGPLITGFKGDTFLLNVKDDLTDDTMDLATSIHWHGLFQKTTNYADGPSFVTQCPIVPTNSFQYNFKAPDQAGTFWYHSHFKNQYCDGLRGAFVVYDPLDPNGVLYDIDDESTVITLADWYHYLSTNAPPVPQIATGLINGKGRYSGGPTNVPLSVINVVQGLRYRFRVVSISCDAGFTFSIDQHKLTVIEADGQNTKPLLVDNVLVLAGQRYSVVMKADQPIANYWIRSVPPGQTTDGGQNSAILRYLLAPDSDPTSTSTLSLPLVETNLHPLTSSPVPGSPTPGGADININLDIAFSFTTFEFEVNGTPFHPPNVPALLQILSGTSSVTDLLPSGSYYALEAGKSVEITMPGGAIGGPHPIHLHGHAFHVVRSAGNSTYNFDDPVIRDVVSIGTSSSDQTTIRFVADNPGPWFLHCHIDWHLNTGLAVVFAEDIGDIPAQDPVPDAWKNLCPLYNTFIGS
ncbi:multicopper oxidase [Auriscalpium vulgare]|uniref:Multicopper oxidase n=1 Tax=Auriscalpium vulgare TaxID=40419 RepID=A0ACB8S6T2_9AGAM|nr:multicopper oxidase [Auriscalpium vulgare]